MHGTGDDSGKKKRRKGDDFLGRRGQRRGQSIPVCCDTVSSYTRTRTDPPPTLEYYTRGVRRQVLTSRQTGVKNTKVSGDLWAATATINPQHFYQILQQKNNEEYSTFIRIVHGESLATFRSVFSIISWDDTNLGRAMDRVRTCDLPNWTTNKRFSYIYKIKSSDTKYGLLSMFGAHT